MILYRLGPCRLSPSLMVWQVRQALLKTCCSDAAALSCDANSWDRAECDASMYAIALTITIRRTQSRCCTRKPCGQPAFGRAMNMMNCRRFIPHLVDEAIAPLKTASGPEIVSASTHCEITWCWLPAW